VSTYFYPHDTGAAAGRVRAPLAVAACAFRADVTCAFRRAEQRVDGAVVQEATFRGRQLCGVAHTLPEGYHGA
jgi:hypothetical protein